MRTRQWVELTLLQFVVSIYANTEKTIFVAPKGNTIPNVHPGLDDLCIDSLSSDNSVLRTQLSVAFPNKTSPKGLQSWYLLDQLNAGQRYEVRVCWAATQPTEFWLDTFTLTQVFETPELISGLAEYSENQPQSVCQKRASIDPSEPSTKPSILFLRIHSAADFFTTNKTLMSQPPLVDVDITLDPFILNVLPKSLLPTAAYITPIAVGAWLLSGMVWKWLSIIGQGEDGKAHGD
ncbi:hypothetical protein EJ08DRAFT_599867 [Tothia fuscella]|uniref:Phosphatidylinositol-glycan biosynthesis class X protein n=1 Tax=Tothia fuscella TaxID=1048955 RepID=A0A9P4NEL9_9PEZI|nr:hypothetical protein EJ08DRAFT_599867 [Tothia fuscella]